MSTHSTDAVTDRRRHTRHAVRIEATLHRAGGTQPVIVNDISAGGAGLERAIGIFPDDSVEIEFAEGRRVAGIVVWWMSGCCGVHFIATLADDDPLLREADWP